MFFNMTMNFNGSRLLYSSPFASVLASVESSLMIRNIRFRTPSTETHTRLTQLYARAQPPPQIYINTWTARRGARDLMDGWPDHSADCFAPDSDRKEIYNLSSLSARARASEQADERERERESRAWCCASPPLSTYLPTYLYSSFRSISDRSTAARATARRPLDLCQCAAGTTRVRGREKKEPAPRGRW